MSGRALAFVVALGVGPAAWAGACCVGSTTTVPVRLGECERWIAGTSLQLDASTGRWTRDGHVADSSLAEQSLIATVAGGYRWDRKGQISVTLPAMLNHKATGSSDAWGGGPGDVRVVATWNPLTERWVAPGKLAPPVPVFSAGLRLPTGTSWREAKGALFEDVTGLHPAAVMLGLDAERMSGRWPWAVGLDAEVGLESGRMQPTLRLYGGIGRTLGTDWSVLLTTRYVATWAGSDHADTSARTTVGARVTHGRRLAWRTWAAVEADVPLPSLGRSTQRQVSGALGFALVR